MRAPLRCWALLPIVSRGLCHRWSIIFSSADIRVSWIRQSIRPSITLIRKGSPVNHEKQSPLPKSLTSDRKFLRHLFLLECSNFAETVDRLRSSLNPAKLLFNQKAINLRHENVFKRSTIENPLWWEGWKYACKVERREIWQIMKQYSRQETSVSASTLFCSRNQGRI